VSAKNVFLGDLLDITMGQAPPSKECNFDGIGTPFVKAGEFGKKSPLIREWTTKPIKKGKQSDIFICVVGATCGKINYGVDCAIGRSVAALSPKTNLLNRDYLYYFLSSMVSVLREGSLGAAQTVISKDMINRIPILLPPLATQQRIVAKLDAIFAEIGKATAAAEANVKNAEALFQSYLSDVFERGGEGWIKARLKDVVCEVVTGPFGSSLHKSDYVESGIPVVNPQNLINGKIIPLEKTMVSQTTKERLKKYSLKVKDIVIARRGEMGRCGLVDSDTEGWLCGTGSMIIRLNDKANENFIFQLLQSDRVRTELERSSIGATMSNLNQSILLNIQFMLPPIEFQMKTLESIKDFSLKSVELSESYEKKANEYLSLRQSILRQAFNGELVKE
jgi:type I restriction enzyme S subunit